MEQKSIKYGLKLWSSNAELIPEARTAHSKGKFDFIELYVDPLIPRDFKVLAALLDIPVTIHATHSHGFHEFVIGDEQKRIWRNCIDLADYFSSPVIVVHPGRNHTLKSFKENLAAIDDKRIYIENMAGLDIHGNIMFGQTLTDLQKIKELKPICFDFEKAIKAACHQKLGYKEYITKGLSALTPSYFHLSGGDKDSAVDEHKNLDDSNFDLGWIKLKLFSLNRQISLVFETPKERGLENDLNNMDYFRGLSVEDSERNAKAATFAFPSDADSKGFKLKSKLKSLKTFMNDAPLTIRKITLEDAKILFEWRNNKETRENSRTAAPVEWKSHLMWLEKSLTNPSRILCIVEQNGEPVGTVRADMRDDGFTEISYTVAPNARGKGLSKPMVVQFVKKYLSGKKIVADIKKGHGPSESVAKVLGLLPHHEIPSTDPKDSRPMVEWR